MPNMSLYIDEELYLALKIEADKSHKPLYSFIQQTLKKACNKDACSDAGGENPSSSSGLIRSQGRENELGLFPDGRILASPTFVP